MQCVPCLGCFLVFIVCPVVIINIWHRMLCYLPNIYNYITFKASLERVQFEFLQSFPVVYVLCFSMIFLYIYKYLCYMFI